MKLVHLADLHLGFRQYERQTEGGSNQREADVASTLQKVIDKVLEIRPDIVLVAGDVFHTPRPTNSAIVHAFLQFTRLMQGLPQSIVVMVAGNHDTPRTAESVSILRLFSSLGINIAERTAKRFSFRDGVSVLAVPEMSGTPALEIDPAARINLLVIHGEVQGVIPRHTDRPPMSIEPRTLEAQKWDYIALGHYHVYREVLPNAFYSGSIDYTSSNPWGEMVEEKGIGKGIIERDLETGAHTFHAIPPARILVDLPPIEGGAELSPAAIDDAIRERVEQCEGGIDGKIVRLIMKDVPRHMVRELDHKALRELKRRALHFNLDSRRPEILRPPKPDKADPADTRRRRPSLAEMLTQKLRERAIAGDIDREGLVALGLHYLEEAGSTAGLPETVEAES